MFTWKVETMVCWYPGGDHVHGALGLPMTALSMSYEDPGDYLAAPDGKYLKNKVIRSAAGFAKVAKFVKATCDI